MASAIELIQKAETRLTSLNNNQVARIKSEVGMKFDKAVIVREFEVVATSMKQVQEALNSSKIDPSGPSPEGFQKQMYEANQKIQGLEGQLKETKNEYKEYKIENEVFKRDSKRFEEECTTLKAEVLKLTQSNQKLFSDLMDSRKQL